MNRTFAAWLVVGCLAIACSRAEAPTPPAETSSPAATATRPAITVTVPALPAPTNVRLTGRLPDTNATVPAGEGEAGRVTIEWNAAAGAEGYRLFMQDCAGKITPTAIELGAGERRYGPLQPCRPGGKVGVAAFSRAGGSVIVWVP